MEAQVLTPLNALESSVSSLLSSLITTNTFSTAPSATRELLAADSELTSSLSRLKQHQENYARILSLKAEADRLQEKLRDTIRASIDLRQQIGNIHPSILEEDEEESDSQRQPKDVDYETLLGFAARIGKHNAVAAREAEQDSIRRKVEAAEQKPKQVNGDPGNNSQADEKTTQEAQDRIAAIKEMMASQRASLAMAFPQPETLRLGILGRLQLLREQQGERAVELEIERLVKASENIADMDSGPSKETEQHVVESSTANQPVPKPAQTERAHARPPPPQPKQKPVSLDFDDDSDDDD